MSKTVLCAVDISNKHHDDKVLREAARMAALDDAQLDVITVVPNLGMSLVASHFSKDYNETAMAEAKTQLKALVREVLGDKTDAGVRHMVAMGSAYEEILKAAKADEASLIVIGAHKPDFTDYLLGPNAARVVRHSACSVYVVR